MAITLTMSPSRRYAFSCCFFRFTLCLTLAASADISRLRHYAADAVFIDRLLFSLEAYDAYALYASAMRAAASATMPHGRR